MSAVGHCQTAPQYYLPQLCPVSCVAADPRRVDHGALVTVHAVLTRFTWEAHA